MQHTGDIGPFKIVAEGGWQQFFLEWTSMSLIHKPADEKRMLVILPVERYDDWLDSL